MLNHSDGFITSKRPSLPSWQASTVQLDDYGTDSCSSSAGSKDRHVQRSVSLKLDTKPAVCGGRQPRDIRDINGNFELAHLLERAGSLDAKFMKEIKKEEERMSEWNRKPLPNWPSVVGVTSSLKDVGENGGESDDGNSVGDVRRCSISTDGGGSEGLDGSTGGLEKVTLPMRYRQIMLQKRRASRSTHQPMTSSSSGGGGESLTTTHTLGSLLEDDAIGREDASSESGTGTSRVPQRVSFAVNSSLLDRQNDAKLAIQWTHQEIRALKQQNRTLLRQLMDLGAAIHRRGGMDSCQSVADNISSSGTYDSIGSKDTSLQDSLAMSMVSIPMVPTAPPKKSRFSFHNSLDHYFFRRDS